jgi:FHS family glucose/mannose:H+ symporter-like MFS transporter
MPSVDPSQSRRSAQVLTAAAHAAFVPVGIVTVLLGPMLPTLSARWSLDYTQAGSLFTVQFAATTVAVVLSGFVASRWGFRFAINSGLLVMAAALALLPHGARPVGLVCIAAWGAGMGLAVPACNLLVAEVNPQRRSAALSLLNFSWSVGAVSCPFLVSAALRHHATVFFFHAVAGFTLLVFAGIAASALYVKNPTRSVGGADIPKAAIPWSDRTVSVLAALFFLYVGAECALGGWIASYARSMGTSPSTVAVMTPSFFYFALLPGAGWHPSCCARWTRFSSLKREFSWLALVWVA